MAEEIVLSELIFTDVFRISDNFIQGVEDTLFSNNKDLNGLTYTGCATISVSPFDSVTWPKEISIDFGDTNCFGTDGRYRRGIINIISDKSYNDSSAHITISFDNYFFNNIKIIGLMSITNIGTNNSGLIQYDVEINDASLITARGTITMTMKRTITKSLGNDTPWPALNDDLFIMTGESNGKSTSGYPFTTSIVSQVLLSHGCPWFLNGVIEATPELLEIITIDYGSGSCDKNAKITINAEEMMIEMP
ncbi:MAG: hypothetical protein PHT69_15825 [Bacteroidales bacterium]|nr:hypothetical protein [Bacteroidales bacterium]